MLCRVDVFAAKEFDATPLEVSVAILSSFPELVWAIFVQDERGFHRRVVLSELLREY